METKQAQEGSDLPLEAWGRLWKGPDVPSHYRDHVHELLCSNFPGQAGGRPNLKILVPLCGKTMDLKWLAGQGHYVVGVEMVEAPVKAMFSRERLEFDVEISDIGPIYKALDGRITVYVSNVFHLSRDNLGLFDIIWDRAAFVALNTRDRQRYVTLLKSVMADGCRYLLSAVDMKKSSGGSVSGPPHVTSPHDIQELFGDEYTVTFLESLDCTHQADPTWEIEWFYEKLYLITPCDSR